MPPLLLIPLLLAFSGAEFRHESGVRIEVALVAQIYTWTVHNETADPVISFQIEAHNVYNHEAPTGWTISYENPDFRAWTDDTQRAIRPGGRGEFSARVSSRGAVLGEVPISIGFADAEQRITLADVWGPRRRPISQYVLIPVVIAAIALFHFVLVRNRR